MLYSNKFEHLPEPTDPAGVLRWNACDHKNGQEWNEDNIGPEKMPQKPRRTVVIEARHGDRGEAESGTEEPRKKKNRTARNHYWFQTDY